MPKGNGKSKGAQKTGPPPRNMSYRDYDPTQNQHYAKITKLWGHGRTTVQYFGNGQLYELSGMIRQRRGLNKLKAMNGSFVIISLRKFEKSVADVLHIYRDDEVRILRRNQEIPPEIDSGGLSKEAEVTFGYDHEDTVDEFSSVVDYTVDKYGIPINQDSDSD